MISAQAEPAAQGSERRHLVGLDIDGTLLVTGQEPTPAVLAGIRAALYAGHVLVLATGRSLSGALYAARLLGITDGWIVASNGSIVVRLNRGGYDVVGIHTVDAKAVVEFVSVVRPDLWIAAEIVGVGYHVSKLFPPQQLGGEQVEVTRPEDLWAEATPRLAIYGTGAQNLVPSIRAGGMTATRTRPDWVDVTAGGVSKATALETIRRELGIPKSRTVAIGDSENDISMLTWAERGIAMGNASALVRFSANYATKDVEDDGAALILHALAQPDREDFANETRTGTTAAASVRAY
jgi:HAD superfamily hydrolase (TIGR01484 family)